MGMPRAKLAVVTGASTGIGYELARLAVAGGYDLIAAADEPILLGTSRHRPPTAIQTIEVNLATAGGVDLLVDTIAGRPVDVLCANAGTALGQAFLDQPVADWQHVVETNVTGTLLLLHQLLPRMITRDAGRILVTGSINGSIPGPYLAVYNATKAFLNNFTDALRDEIRESAVTLTTLMPGPVETPVYARAGMLDTIIGAISKPGAAGVARAGWDAMLRGDAHIIPGVVSKIVETLAHITPAAITAELHRIVAKPGS